MKPDIQKYLFLAIGLMLFLVSNGRWIVPVATWLSFVFLVRYFRSQKGTWHTTIGAIAVVSVYCIAWQGLIHLSGLLFYAVAGGIGLVFLVPFLMDKFLSPRIPGLLATLVFPLAWTSIEFIGFQFTPYGTWGSLAYTQYGNLPLMQIVSITGIYGLSFLVAWFASVVNWLWEESFEWARVGKGTTIYVGVLLLVLLYGGACLVYFSPKGAEVKVSGVQSSMAEEVLEPALDRLNSRDYSKESWDFYFAKTDIVVEDLFARSEAVAKNGAKMVSWAENPVMIRQSDEPAFIERAARLAKQEQTYLVLNYSINLGSDPTKAPAEKVWSTRTTVVAPTGEVSPKYRKTILVPGYEATIAQAGNDKAAVTETPHGRISSLICFDNDFPAFVRRQVGREDVDILFVPSGDWKEIDPYHTHMVAFRAIENGFSVVRVTGLGLSAAYDYQGRPLATMDYFKTKDKVFTAYVPTEGVATIYSRVGDLFAWLSVAGLLAIAGLVVAKRKPKA